MPYNLAIPGQVDIFQLRAIEVVAGLVPDHGAVVEVGSLFGRSSWAWARSVAPTATVYCIDPWRDNLGVIPMETQHDIKYGLEQFQAYVSDCENIEPLIGYSPEDFLEWSKPVDLYYEDAVHQDPTFSRNLEFWTSLLQPGGVVCGDDFRLRFPDVVRGVQRLSVAMGRELITVGFFWCLLPSCQESESVHTVRSSLLNLSEEARALSASSLGSIQTVCRIIDPKSILVAVEVTITNNSAEFWPSTKMAGLAVLAIEVYVRDKPTAPIAVEQFWLEYLFLVPDRHHVQVVELQSLSGSRAADLELRAVLKLQEFRADACPAESDTNSPTA